MIEQILLSPQGRELMEQRAEEMGDKDYPLGDMGLLIQIKYLNGGNSWGCQLIFQEAYFFGEHKSKHMACLLAFAQLVGVYDPEKMEVVE